MKSKTTIRWKISDLSLIIEDHSWSSLAITFEARGSLGRNYQWRVSLFSDENYLYGRAELISPIKYRIPYQIEFNITNIEGIEQGLWCTFKIFIIFNLDLTFKINFCNILIFLEKDLIPREITSQDDPQKWKICSSQYLQQLNNDNNVLELSIQLQCFGSETTQGFQIQNFPY